MSEPSCLVGSPTINPCRDTLPLVTPGYGEDCYRTWESVLLRSVPVVRDSPIAPVYAGAPVYVLRVSQASPVFRGSPGEGGEA